MAEIIIWRIIFHTPEEREDFEKVKKIITAIIAPEMVKTLEPPDGGKKAIFFAATPVQKKKIEKLLKNAELSITISSPLVPC